MKKKSQKLVSTNNTQVKYTNVCDFMQEKAPKDRNQKFCEKAKNETKVKSMNFLLSIRTDSNHRELTSLCDKSLCTWLSLSTTKKY